jgi:hypothetical protein
VRQPVLESHKYFAMSQNGMTSVAEFLLTLLLERVKCIRNCQLRIEYDGRPAHRHELMHKMVLMAQRGEKTRKKINSHNTCTLFAKATRDQ